MSSTVIYRLLILLLLQLLDNNASWAQVQKPNIIIINMDDMGYGDIEPYGMTGIKTPNFNAFAAAALRLTNCEVAQGVCTASRTALLTGCYPNRLGMSGALMPWSDRALNPEEETIASLLRNARYKTAIVGKWHLGMKAPFLPLSYGFEQYYGLPYSNDMWAFDAKGDRFIDSNDLRSRYPPLPLIEGNTIIDTIETMRQQDELTTLYTEKAVRFIHQNKHRLFFLYLAHNMPHVPLAVSKKFKGKSGVGLYGDVVMELDWSLGQIVKALELNGLSGKTIVIVTSDNGPWKNYGNHGGSTGGLREGKQTIWEGSTRVPFLIKWPGQIKPGIASELFTHMDILPTIAAAAKTGLPKKPIDGINFLPYFKGAQHSSPREIFYYYYDGNSLKAIRYNQWKLILPHTGISYTVFPPGMDGLAGKTTVVKVDTALYNLSLDPGETYDVKQYYPEVMRQILRAVELAKDDMGDALTDRKGRNLRRPARVAN